MRILKGKRGFTLLEVLIVIAIVIIIAGIALPRFIGVSEEGKRARAKGDERVLQTAVESYILNKNLLPDCTATCTDLETTDPIIVSDFTQFKDPFSTVAGGAVYKYATASNATTGRRFYVFWSVGRNAAGTLAVSNTGVVSGQDADDIWVSNGKPSAGG